MLKEQLEIEEYFNKYLVIDAMKKEILDDPELVKDINKGIDLLLDWMDQDFYPSKRERVDKLKDLVLFDLVLTVVIETSQCTRATLYTNITALIASKLLFDNNGTAITLVAEIVAVLAPLELYEIFKAGANGSLYLKTTLSFGEELEERMERSDFLPPLIMEPKEIESNKDSGYYTYQKSVVLKNSYDVNVSRDVLNIQNKIEFKLNVSFISKHQETVNTTSVQIGVKNYIRYYLEMSKYFYNKFIEVGHFYLINRFDSRGRIYPSGYWITTMGNSFKKASVQFYKEEFIEVPPEYRDN